jgi:hypothetical protein
MELILRDLGIQSLKEHLNKCREYRESLAKEFEEAETSLHQTNLAFRWDAALKHGYMVHFLHELLERREKEGRPSVEVQYIQLKTHRHRAPVASEAF